MKKMPPSTRPLSEVAAQLKVPDGIVSTGWPSIARQLIKMAYPLDSWQVDIGRLVFAKRKDGFYAAGVGGAALSLPRQVGKTHMIAGFIFAACIASPNTLVLWSAHRARTHNETFQSMQGIAARPAVARSSPCPPRCRPGGRRVREWFTNSLRRARIWLWSWFRKSGRHCAG